MLAVTGGREGTLTEYRDLLSAADIDLAGTTLTATPFSIVEGRTWHVHADSGSICRDPFSGAAHHGRSRTSSQVPAPVEITTFTTGTQAVAQLLMRADVMRT